MGTQDKLKADLFETKSDLNIALDSKYQTPHITSSFIIPNIIHTRTHNLYNIYIVVSDRIERFRELQARASRLQRTNSTTGGRVVNGVCAWLVGVAIEPGHPWGVGKLKTH